MSVELPIVDRSDVTQSQNHFQCKIPCLWRVVYIGQTGKSINTRQAEPERFLGTGLLIMSAVTEHQKDTVH